MQFANLMLLTHHILKHILHYDLCFKMINTSARCFSTSNFLFTLCTRETWAPSSL